VTELNNPAARLHYWLQVGRQRAKKDPATSAQVTWCDVWDLDHSKQADKAECLRRGLGLTDAARETRALAEASPNPIAAHGLSTFGQIEVSLQQFTVLPRTKNETFFQGIKDDGMLGLSVLATLFGLRDSRADVVRGTGGLAAG
jgi:hypothetical protein